MPTSKQGDVYTVYMHTTPSGKRYIGITAQTVEKRWQNGFGYAYGENDYFFNAIKKYGWDNIKHEILFTGLTKSDAEEKEIELIAKYNTTSRDCGYNRETGGYACPKHTDESKRRMSKMQKEIWDKSPERKVKLAEYRRGKSLSEETKEKLRQANLGKKQSPETIEKRAQKLRGMKKPKTSQAMKSAWDSGRMKGMTGKHTSEKQKEAARKSAIIMHNSCKIPIVQVDANGNIIAEYDSAADAKRILNLPYAVISDVCKGKRTSTYGLRFRYKEE